MARGHCHTLCEPTCFMVLRFSVERGEGRTACRSGTGLAGVSPSNFEYNYVRILAEPECCILLLSTKFHPAMLEMGWEYNSTDYSLAECSVAALVLS